MTAKPNDPRLRIKRELGRVQRSIFDKKTPSDQRELLYAVQQALCWALDPCSAMRPYKMVMQDKGLRL